MTWTSVCRIRCRHRADVKSPPYHATRPLHDQLNIEMGAFDGWFGKRSDDPLKDLDPKVREFLEKESPIKIERKKQDDSQSAAAAQAEAEAAAAATTAAVASEKSGVPKESQYQDGRYAHLWKTYRPLSEIENETKSDHERLSDVLEAYKGRQSAIGSAALENCAEEQFDWNNCMKSGSLRARMTMCRDEVRKFEQCYNMQTVRSRPPQQRYCRVYDHLEDAMN